MTETDHIEAALLRDLQELGERHTDEEFSTELYKALAGGRLTKDGDSLSLSWSRAEGFVNRLRRERGRDALTLAQTGGEGELSDLVAGELERLGWTWKPLDTGRDDPAHSGQPNQPPPAGTGEARAPVTDSSEWKRTGDEEADAARSGDPDAPAQSLPGTGAGGGQAPRVGGS